jgi:spermidine/putrescine transport system ATP-binding protein
MEKVMDVSFAVELHDVVKRFGTVTAVNHVNVQIKDGEFFSLLGPSGCGKTTTLRLIAGFELPTQGEIYIGGEAQGYLPAYQRPVNTVFQNYALFPHMTVFKNIAFGMEMQGVSSKDIERRVSEALEMVALAKMGERKPRQLSGGQQQRVALARALVNHPKVLLLDEPLGALDLKLRKAMQVELKSLQERVGITFIYVTHDQEEALTMSDRIAVMSQGLLLQTGTPQEIYEAPGSRFVSDFIGETNYLDGIIASRRTGYAEIVVEPDIRLWAREAPGLEVGKQASLAIRPEKITLNQPAQDGDNCISGWLESEVYVGSMTTYTIKLASGDLVIVREQNMQPRLENRLPPGAQVSLTWAIDSCKAFSD